MNQNTTSGPSQQPNLSCSSDGKRRREESKENESTVASKVPKTSTEMEAIPGAPSEDEGERRWHPIHCDPSDDVVVKSNDAMFFRASQYHLSKHSIFFRHLLSVASADHKSVVELDFPQEAITIFLDIISVAEPSSITITLPQCESLLSLAKFIDAAKFHSLVLGKISDSALHKPLDVLFIAGRHLDVELASKAIDCMGNVKRYKSTFATEMRESADEIWYILDRLPLQWALRMVRLFMTTFKTIPSFDLWHRIADDFKKDMMQ